MLEVQIAMKKLELEKTDLHMKNLAIKKDVIASRLEQESKEEDYKGLEKEVLEMQRELREKDLLLQEARNKVKLKDRYIDEMRDLQNLQPNTLEGKSTRQKKYKARE